MPESRNARRRQRNAKNADSISASEKSLQPRACRSQSTITSCLPSPVAVWKSAPASSAAAPSSSNAADGCSSAALPTTSAGRNIGYLFSKTRTFQRNPSTSASDSASRKSVFPVVNRAPMRQTRGVIDSEPGQKGQKESGPSTVAFATLSPLGSKFVGREPRPSAIRAQRPVAGSSRNSEPVASTAAPLPPFKTFSIVVVASVPSNAAQPFSLKIVVNLMEQSAPTPVSKRRRGVVKRREAAKRPRRRERTL